jgi:hypothetical protein
MYVHACVRVFCIVELSYSMMCVLHKRDLRRARVEGCVLLLFSDVFVCQMVLCTFVCQMVLRTFASSLLFMVVLTIDAA